MEPATLTDATELAVRKATDLEGAILLPRGREPHELDEYLVELGLEDALLMTLQRDQRTVALLVVGNRAGDVSTFNVEDRKLFETYAVHASVLLENDQVKEQLRYQAYHDALTRLPNRALFTERVGEVLASGSADTTVLFVDLDDFKTINDTLGHAAGDDLLVAVAERVRACVRPGDLAARLGGDEFGILLECDTDDAAEQIASRLVEALRVPFVLHGREMQVHASIGIASASHGGTDGKPCRRAHRELYFTRYDKRNRLVTGGAILLPFKRRGAHAALHCGAARETFPAAGADQLRLRLERLCRHDPGDFFPRMHKLGPDGFAWVGCNGRAVGLSVALGRELAKAVTGTAVDQLGVAADRALSRYRCIALSAPSHR